MKAGRPPFCIFFTFAVFLLLFSICAGKIVKMLRNMILTRKRWWVACQNTQHLGLRIGYSIPFWLNCLLKVESCEIKITIEPTCNLIMTCRFKFENHLNMFSMGYTEQCPILEFIFGESIPWDLEIIEISAEKQKTRLKYIVSCQGVLQLGGLVPGCSVYVPLRSRLLILF